jgi:hypothetical protein
LGKSHASFKSCRTGITSSGTERHLVTFSPVEALEDTWYRHCTRWLKLDRPQKGVLETLDQRFWSFGRHISISLLVVYISDLHICRVFASASEPMMKQLCTGTVHSLGSPHYRYRSLPWIPSLPVPVMSTFHNSIYAMYASITSTHACRYCTVSDTAQHIPQPSFLGGQFHQSTPPRARPATRTTLSPISPLFHLP